MEFTGEGAKTLSISERMVLCNMAVEAGAKTGIFEPDEKAIRIPGSTRQKAEGSIHRATRTQSTQENIPLTSPRSVRWLAKPDFVDNLVPAEEVRGVKIDEAFLGSCNNGRIEDLRVGASIIKGKESRRKGTFPGGPGKPDRLPSRH